MTVADQGDRPRFPPSITIRVEYRQLGPGPESIEVEWEDGAAAPSAADICAVIQTLATIPTGEPT